MAALVNHGEDTSRGAGDRKTADSSPAPLCPSCGGPVYRVRRRFLDRLISIIVPVRRFRCYSIGTGCQWEGNIRVKRQRRGRYNR